MDTYFERRGDGPRSMLLLHGFGASTFTWRNFMEPLAAHGTVVAYDRPGFGRTPGPAARDAKRVMSFDGQVAHALDFIDAMGLQAPVLIGHSAGGVVAVGVARARPGAVRGLALLATPVRGGPPAVARTVARLPGSGGIAGFALERLAPRFASRAFRRIWDGDTPPTDEELRGYVEPFARRGWGRTWWEMTRYAEDPQLLVRGVPAVPALVLAGSRDGVAPPEAGRALAAAFPAARYVEIAGAGHLLHENRPAEVARHLDAFLTSI